MPQALKITVVTPSYQQVRYLKSAIESVLSQNYPALEYMVVDDGSTDGSVDLIRTYADRLAWWTTGPNHGQACAINKGFARSTGDVLAFLNSDDFYFAGALECVAEAFIAHPNVDIVWGIGQIVSEAGEPLRTLGADFDQRHLLDGGFSPPISQPAFFFRRRVYDKIGDLDPDFHYGLDYEFYSRAFGNFTGMFVPYKLAAMRLQPTAKSVISADRFAPEVMRTAEKVLGSPEEYPNFEVDPAVILSAARLYGARFLYNGGRYGEALGWIACAWKTSTRFRRGIVFHDVPRLLFHSLFGRNAYQGVARLLSSGRPASYSPGK